MILYSSAGGSSSHQPHRGLPSSPTSMLSRHTLCSATSLCTVAPHLRVSRKHVEPAANLAPPHTCQAPSSPKPVHVASTSPDGDTSRSPGSYLPSVISGIGFLLLYTLRFYERLKLAVDRLRARAPVNHQGAATLPQFERRRSL